MVSIYVWFPHGINLGHAAMRVTGGMPVGEMYLSRWPDFKAGFLSALASLTVGVGAVNNAYETDLKAEGGRSPETVQLMYLDEGAIKAAIKDLAAENYYQLGWSNCATQVRECLNAGVAGGLALGLLWSSTIVLGASPLGLLEYARFLRRYSPNR